MKILALIPARGGSKRLPNKNILPLDGKPLIAWTIDAAKGIAEIIDILVSTDSKEIASVAKDAGASVPWLRPDTLSSDTASSIDVCLHALNWYENKFGSIDGLMLLQPTSPFRNENLISDGIALYKRHSATRSIVSFSPADSHPMWCYKLDNNFLHPFIEGLGSNLRSQDLPPAYVINGSLYICNPVTLREKRSFIQRDTIPIIVDSKVESLDIDTDLDLKFAEFILYGKPKSSNASV
jgi:CMP-N,N'-diacetyllegionaminic acid synthase